MSIFNLLIVYLYLNVNKHIINKYDLYFSINMLIAYFVTCFVFHMYAHLCMIIFFHKISTVYSNLMSLSIFQPIGTYGYAAPEYVETGHLKSNSDLWSFGVVLYEILTGRKAVDNNLPQSEQKLIEWVKQFPSDSKRFRMIMDPRLNNQYSRGAAQKVAKLAESCLRKNPEERPPMSRIVDILQQTITESELASNISEMGSPLPEPSTRRMVGVA